jgi:hypothetical protein
MSAQKTHDKSWSTHDEVQFPCSVPSTLGLARCDIDALLCDLVRPPFVWLVAAGTDLF